MRIFRIVLLPVLGLAILAGGIAVSATGSSQAVNESLLAAMRTTTPPPGESFPGIVARVGNQVLTGREFATLVAIGDYSNARQHLGRTQAQVERSALNHVLREASLLARAGAEGVTVTDAEVNAWLSQQRAARSSLPANDPSIADFNADVAASGDGSADAYDRDPRLFQHSRDLMLMGKLIRNHVGANASDAAIEAFVQQTIAASGAQVFVTIR